MIPKILHQIWLGPKRRPEADMNSWRDQHPSWEYRLWTEANLPKLQHQALFDAFHGVYHAQADILRYELLYTFGGIYIDADSRCLRPLDDFFLDDGVWACAENDRGLLANGFLGASPRSPLFAAVLDELAKLDVEAIANEDRDVLCGAAWVLTGPCCLSEVVKETGFSIRVYPGHYFFRGHSDGDGKTVYGDHWWGTTFRLYRDEEKR